jgi:hypothetical protein
MIEAQDLWWVLARVRAEWPGEAGFESAETSSKVLEGGEESGGWRKPGDWRARYRRWCAAALGDIWPFARMLFENAAQVVERLAPLRPKKLPGKCL